FIMLAFPVHVQFSRLAINQVMDPLFTALVLAFLYKALTTDDKVECGLAGVILGLLPYWGAASEMVPFFLIFVVIWFYLQHRERVIQHARLLIIPIMVSAAVVLPQLLFLFSGHNAIVPRLSEIGLGQSLSEPITFTFLVSQMEKSILGYIQLSDN